MYLSHHRGWYQKRQSMMNGASVVGLSQVRTKRVEGLLTTNGDSSSSSPPMAKSPLPRYVDHGEYGFYDGPLRGPMRHGRGGKMYYDSGNYYEGGFVNDKYDGDNGVYRWFDGDEQRGSWRNGERHGTSIFSSASDGIVEYCKYDAGTAIGAGVTWSGNRKMAYEMLDGKKGVKISLDAAETLAKTKFGLPVPEPVILPVKTVLPTTTPSKSMGLFASLFAKRKAGPNGELMFKDYGEWGTYEGEVDEDGNRQGYGKIIYTGGASYEGEFKDNKFHGEKGVYHWSDGDEYEGGWKDMERHGIGIFRSADGTVEYHMMEMGVVQGESIGWDAERKKAHKTMDEKKVEVSLGVAEKMAKERFNLPVPLSTVTVTTTTSAAVAPAAKKTGLFASLFSNRKVGAGGELMFYEYGEWGTYEGEVEAVSGNRQGKGKITYASGAYYEGGFVDDKFHDEIGIYHWSDDDEYEGGWKDGERHGTGIFRSADGTVEYSRFDMGAVKGETIGWDAERKTAYRKNEGEDKKIEISLSMAEKLAEERFNLPVPDPSSTISSAPLTKNEAVSTSNKTGFFAGLFAKRKVGPDGELMFKDYGEWGTYEGEVEAVSGNRQGKGKITYASGAYYEGGFVNDKFHGEKGVYHWSDGDEYEGGWKDGERHGVGVFRVADGTLEVSKYDAGAAKGEGVWLSADRKSAIKLVDGEKTTEYAIEDAATFLKDNYNLSMPSPTQAESVSTQNETLPTSSKVGLLGKLFSKQRIDSDGKLMFKDHGDWGSYDGDVDNNGIRQGKGKMTYTSGSYYEGCFVDDKFHGEKGRYHWSDGEEYEGGWKDGERHGVGVFRSNDGTVTYSMYDSGMVKGEGVWFSANRLIAYKTIDGVNKYLILNEEAAEIAKELFHLPIPEPYKSVGVQASGESTSSNTGLIARLFSNRKISPDGKLMFKDFGEWGTFEGEVDEEGSRKGHGKLTYISGSYYEGSFVDDKFHGAKGVYHWSDGDEYEGEWKDGERYGIGVFRSADGAVMYSMFDAGIAKGEGVAWSTDRKIAHKTEDGVKKVMITVIEAAEIAILKFGLLVPEPYTPVLVTGKKVGLLSRFFPNRKVSPDGKLMFKDNGDWGSYDGEVDKSTGNRQGNGKMIYKSGATYEGSFEGDKYHGEKCIYRWADDTEFEGGFKNGKRHGVSVYRQTDGIVEYTIFEYDAAKGDGIEWSADRKTAYKTVDGKKTKEMYAPGMAAKLAKEFFNLSVPEPFEPPAGEPTSSKPRLLARLFSRSLDSDGNLMFKDQGVWGSYIGKVDDSGNRQGNGKIMYVNGSYYEGGFVNDKFHGDGVYHWADGDEYEGGWNDGERHGVGTFRSVEDGTAEISMFDMGQPRGEGLFWSGDRKTAYKTMNAQKDTEISIAMAREIAENTFGLPPPERGTIKGELRFEDFGDMGTFEGDILNELRHGEGKMLYDSGNSYEGDFINGKFDGSKGSFRWSDGTQYDGSWKDGLFNGVGFFRTPDVGVDYAMYKDGYATGVGLFWSADYTKAYLTLDGVKMTETSLSDAQKLAKAKFGLPTPKRELMPSVREETTQTKVGADGKPLFYDYGLWGSFSGEIDASGERVGYGKMTYSNGSYYIGFFVDDKFHGDKGIYHWSDDDEYEGGWKDGERHGVGVFRSADGTVEYSRFDMGTVKGEGVGWTADRKTAHKYVDAKKKDEISLRMAKKLATELFDLPEPPAFVPKTSSRKTGFFAGLFAKRKVGPDGELMFKDYGEWGTYEGEVEAVSGNRQGKGKMTYASGAYYEGGFVDDKFHGEKGVYHWSDGDEYEGGWKDGERHGVGVFRVADGTLEVSKYDAGAAKGEGVWLSADRKAAIKLVDGEKTTEYAIEDAATFLKDNYNLSMPSPTQAESESTPAVPPQAMFSVTGLSTPATVVSKPGFLKSLFATRSVGPDGELMFKDHGDWGTYEGDIDSVTGNRQGKGKMTYAGGAYYDGCFIDDKFHGAKGVYHWSDGDEYVGSWKNGERYGQGMFTTAEGVVMYSMYEAGTAIGEGVGWTADKMTAFKTLDGDKTIEILIDDAVQLVRQNFTSLSA